MTATQSISKPTDPNVVYVPAYDPWLLYTAIPLSLTQVGIRFPEFFMTALDSTSAMDFESASRRIWVGLVSLGIRLA